MSVRISIILILAIASSSFAAKLIDPTKCPNGCKDDTDCVIKSECKLFDDKSNCGFCVCTEGYKAQGNKCVAIKGWSTTTLSTTTATIPTTSTTESTTETSTTATSTTSASTAPTTTGTTTQGPPPVPDPVYCPDFACSVAPPSDVSDSNPLLVRSQLVDTGANTPGCKRQLVIPPRPCNLLGGGACYGSYCLAVTPGNDYCICPYYRVGRQCAVEKQGTCDSATGQIPRGLVPQQGKRLRNPTNKDNGSIYGRHFAPSINDCIKLCQWAQPSQCRSVNFGQIGSANVCEMLSITAAQNNNLLASWLENAPGWQYAQVAPIGL